MKKTENLFQIVENIKEKNHTAGSKAPDDVIYIASKLGFKIKKINICSDNIGVEKKVYSQISYIQQWKKLYKNIPDKATLLLQYPSYFRQLKRKDILLKLKKVKKARFIVVVHDLNGLRNTKSVKKFGDLSFKDILKIADKIIVHNSNMKKYLIDNFDVSSNKLIVLKIFDYLKDSETVGKMPDFKKIITIAGNLDINKSGYLQEINDLDVDFKLYGPNYTLKPAKNIYYGGSLKPEEVPNVLNSGFGLIWDGPSLDTCSGSYGEYLKYNNPHKLSLYLVSGLPVFIWKAAAEAQFVKENKIGFLIKSLSDIPKIMNNLTIDEYEELAHNVKKISIKLAAGDYMKEALLKSLANIKEKI